MKKLIYLILLFAIAFIPADLISAEVAVANIEQEQTQEQPQEQAQAEESSKSEISYKPTLYGSVRAKYEQSVITGEHRFNVRNSRLGVKGYASENVKYAIQIDFNNEGKVSILDSYVSFARDNLEVTLGQQQYHFNKDLDRGPTSSLFSNRSFLSKYLTTYYSSTLSDGEIVDNVSTIGSRDIGLMVSYEFATKWVPISFTAGLMNGSGANNPEWTESVNGVARIAFGDYKKGLQAAASIYGGSTPTESRVITNSENVLEQVSYNQKIRMYGGELRYAGNRFLIEAAYAERHLGEGDDTHKLKAGHIHGYYKFTLPKNEFADHIAPHLRYDSGRGIEFINQVSGDIDRYNSDRVTIALNIGLTQKWMRSEIRLSYEDYILKGEPSDFWVNPLLQDKYTIEFIAAF